MNDNNDDTGRDIDDLLEVMGASQPVTGDFEYVEVGGDVEDDAAQVERRSILRILRRLVVSADAVLSAEEVIEEVGGRAAIVRAWLRNAEVYPLRHPSGRRVYRWGDIVEAMRRAS